MEREYPNPYQAVTAVDYGQYFDYNKANQEIAKQQPKPPAPLYQAPVESGFDYNAANAQIAAQTAPQAPQAPQAPATPKSAEEIMAGIMGELPKPEKNQATQDRLSRIMKIKALGEGLGALGDIFALSQGANVNRRGPDQSISRYRHMYEQNEADYLRRMDDYNRELHRQKLQSLMFGVQRSDREEDMRFRAGQAAQEQQNFEKQFDWNVDKTKADLALDAQKQAWNMAYQKMTADERERHNRQTEAASWLRANNTGKSASQAGRYTIYDAKGKGINLEANEREAVLMKILGDKSIQMDQDELDLLRPRMGEPISVNAINMLVQKYWERSPDAKEYINSKYNPDYEGKPKAGIPWRMDITPPQSTGSRQTAPSTVQQQTSPAQPVQKKKQSAQDVLNKQVAEDTVLNPDEIVSKWKTSGHDIVNDKPYRIAGKMAEEANIPEKDRPAWIAQMTLKIQKEKDLIDTAKTMQGLNYDPNVTVPQTQKQQITTAGAY